MNSQISEFTAHYISALRQYLKGTDEETSSLVCASGNKAVDSGETIAGLIEAQSEMLFALLRSSGDAERDRVAERALRILAESLSWSAEYGARLQQSVTALETVGDQLRRQNEELFADQKSLDGERVRYQTLFDLAPDAYLVTGAEGAIWEANTAAAALLRTDKELLPGQSLLGFVADRDREDLRARLHALHMGSIERIDDWEVRILPRHAAAIPAALTVVAERTVPTALAGLHWLLRDVTERRMLENERAGWLVSRTRAKAARRFEFLSKASALLVGPPDLEASLVDIARLSASFLRGWCFVTVVDANGSLRQLESAHPDSRFRELAGRLRTHRIFGGQAELLPAQPVELELARSDWIPRLADGPEHAAMLRELGGDSAAILPLRVRERLVGAIVLIRTPDSRRYGAADRIMFEDLAHRCALAIENARLYREVVAQRDRAEKVNRIKDEFVAILGHELRNPLMPIAGWTRVLKTHPEIMQNATLAEGCRALERNTAALTRLVGECTDLVRISEGKLQVEQTLIDMNQIVQSAADSVRPAAAERGLTLVAELEPRPVVVEGDAMRLEQVMSNLLINAVKYTNSGRIVVRTEIADEYGQIEITDTGIGIEPEYLEQIFEPFRQGGSAWLTSASGLGLGLAIARRIVEMHGGRIWAESAGIGAGSTFRMRLPRAAQMLRIGNAEESPPPMSRDTEKIRILLIEDSADIRFLVKNDLESMGHTVITASDGSLGLAAAKASLPDLVISDIKMPQMDGYALIRALRSDPVLGKKPAIALTGFGARTEAEKAVEAGFDVCLTKPVDPESIEEAIEKLWRRPQRVAEEAQTTQDATPP